MLAYVTPILPYVDPMLASCSPMLALEMLSPIAVTETTEVGRGWERGGEGVGTGWGRVGRRLGRHASITFGYQAKASGKDTGCGCWPSPGFKGYRPCRRPQQCAVVCQVSIILVNDLAKPLRLSDSKQLKYITKASR